MSAHTTPDKLPRTDFWSPIIPPPAPTKQARPTITGHSCSGSFPRCETIVQTATTRAKLSAFVVVAFIAMNATTTKALSLALVVAVWTIVSHLGKLPLQLWPVIVGLACFVGAGGGMMGLQKSVLGSLSGVVWALIY